MRAIAVFASEEPLREHYCRRLPLMKMKRKLMQGVGGSLMEPCRSLQGLGVLRKAVMDRFVFRLGKEYTMDPVATEKVTNTLDGLRSHDRGWFPRKCGSFGVVAKLFLASFGSRPIGPTP